MILPTVVYIFAPLINMVALLENIIPHLNNIIAPFNYLIARLKNLIAPLLFAIPRLFLLTPPLKYFFAPLNYLSVKPIYSFPRTNLTASICGFISSPATVMTVPSNRGQYTEQWAMFNTLTPAVTATKTIERKRSWQN